MSANIWLLIWSVLPFKVSLADVMHFYARKKAKVMTVMPECL